MPNNIKALTFFEDQDPVPLHEICEGVVTQKVVQRLKQKLVDKGPNTFAQLVKTVSNTYLRDYKDGDYSVASFALDWMLEKVIRSDGQFECDITFNTFHKIDDGEQFYLHNISTSLECGKNAIVLRTITNGESIAHFAIISDQLFSFLDHALSQHQAGQKFTDLVKAIITDFDLQSFNGLRVSLQRRLGQDIGEKLAKQWSVFCLVHFKRNVKKHSTKYGEGKLWKKLAYAIPNSTKQRAKGILQLCQTVGKLDINQLENLHLADVAAIVRERDPTVDWQSHSDWVMFYNKEHILDAWSHSKMKEHPESPKPPQTAWSRATVVLEGS